MDFQKLPTVENAEFYVELAFSRAKKRVGQLLGSFKGKSELDKTKTLEIARIQTVHDNLKTHFQTIVEAYPSFDSLSEFYQEILDLYYPTKDLKKAISTLDWAVRRSQDIMTKTMRMIKSASSKQKAEEYRSSYYGRIVSILKQIDKYLTILSESREKLRSFPNIKDSLFTIAIVGFPNVGKSTLLSKLTFSMPEAKAYPFTTKGLNLGYARIKHDKIQFIDTPGTLNREEKMNNIEKHAYLTMRYLADVLLYVFDPTESYPIELQKQLFDRTKEDFDKPLLSYLSKTDLINQELINKFKEEYPEIMTNPKEIMDKISEIHIRER